MLIIVDARELSSLCNCASVTEGSSPGKQPKLNLVTVGRDSCFPCTCDGTIQTKYRIIHAYAVQLYCRDVVMVCTITFRALCSNSQNMSVIIPLQILAVRIFRHNWYHIRVLSDHNPSHIPSPLPLSCTTHSCATRALRRGGGAKNRTSSRSRSSRSRSSPSLSSTCICYKTSILAHTHTHQKISHKSVPSAAWVAHIPQARTSENQSQTYQK